MEKTKRPRITSTDKNLLSVKVLSSNDIIVTKRVTLVKKSANIKPVSCIETFISRLLK